MIHFSISHKHRVQVGIFFGNAGLDGAGAVGRVVAFGHSILLSVFSKIVPTQIGKKQGVQRNRFEKFLGKIFIWFVRLTRSYLLPIY